MSMQLGSSLIGAFFVVVAVATAAAPFVLGASAGERKAGLLLASINLALAFMSWADPFMTDPGMVAREKHVDIYLAAWISTVILVTLIWEGPRWIRGLRK